MHTEGQECMKVLKRVDEDLSSLSSKATQQKAELVLLEKKVQKQDLKILKLMECIDSALERINNLEELTEKKGQRIRALEEEVEELKPKVFCCKGKEREVEVPKEVRRGYRMCLIHSDLFPYRKPLGWSTSLLVLTLTTWRT